MKLRKALEKNSANSRILKVKKIQKWEGSVADRTTLQAWVDRWAAGLGGGRGQISGKIS